MNLTITTYTEDIALGVSETPEIITLNISESVTNSDAELRAKLGNTDLDYKLIYDIHKL